jgi:LPS export ABC transporter permease LptF/LPS export ABC transporter permease LptG
MRLWSRLDRYIVREMTGPLVLGLVGFTSVMLLNYVFLLARQTIEKQVPLRLVLGFVVAHLPVYVTLTLPMAGLLAVLVAVGRLSSQHELTAMRAAGMSLSRVFRPVGVYLILITAGTLLISHVLQPMGRAHESRLVQEIIRARDLSKEIDPGLFYDRLPGGAVLYAEKAVASREGRVFEGVLLFRERRDGSLSELILARRGQGDFDPRTGQISLRLDDVEWHLYDPAQPERYSRVSSPHETLTFPPDASFRALTSGQNRGVRFRELRSEELLEKMAGLDAQIAETDRRGKRVGLEARRRRASSEWHRRWAFPLAIPLLGLVAFPMAARSRRGGRFAGLVQALCVIFVFWLLFALGTGLAEQGAWPIWAGVWLAHAVTALWAATLWWMLLRSDVEAPGPLDQLAGWLAVLLPQRQARKGAAHHRARVVHRDRWIGLTRIDSYLIGGLLRMFATGLVVLLVLTGSILFKEAIEEVDSGASRFPWADIAAYVGLSVPTQLQFLVPVAALFGVMVSLAGLARTHELVAMKASGIGPFRIAVPLVLATLGISALYGAVQESVVPSSQTEAKRALDRIRGRASMERTGSGRRWVVGEPGHFWSYVDSSSDGDRLIGAGVLVVDMEEARLLERLEVSEAVHRAGAWSFRDGWRRRFFTEAPPRFARVEHHRAALPEQPHLFGATRSRFFFGSELAEQMSFVELRKHLDRVARAGYDRSALLVGLHKKVANPLVPTLLVLLGVPLMVSGTARRGSLYGFGFALLISLGFWGVWAMTISLGREGALAPALAVWAAPGALILMSLLLLGRAR